MPEKFHIVRPIPFMSYIILSLKGGVVVQEVHAGGPADKGGKLRPGDIILKVHSLFTISLIWYFSTFDPKVNDTDFTGLTHKDAQSLLRYAAQLKYNSFISENNLIIVSYLKPLVEVN